LVVYHVTTRTVGYVRYVATRFTRYVTHVVTGYVTLRLPRLRLVTFDLRYVPVALLRLVLVLLILRLRCVWFTPVVGFPTLVTLFGLRLDCRLRLVTHVRLRLRSFTLIYTLLRYVYVTLRLRLRLLRTCCGSGCVCRCRTRCTALRLRTALHAFATRTACPAHAHALRAARCYTALPRMPRAFTHRTHALSCTAPWLRHYVCRCAHLLSCHVVTFTAPSPRTFTVCRVPRRAGVRAFCGCYQHSRTAPFTVCRTRRSDMPHARAGYLMDADCRLAVGSRAPRHHAHCRYHSGCRSVLPWSPYARAHATRHAHMMVAVLTTTAHAATGVVNSFDVNGQTPGRSFTYLPFFYFLPLLLPHRICYTGCLRASFDGLPATRGRSLPLLRRGSVSRVIRDVPWTQRQRHALRLRAGACLPDMVSSRACANTLPAGP